MKNTGAQLQDFLDKILNSTAYQQGNATEYSPNNVAFNSASPLAGKRIAFLGSSVSLVRLLMQQEIAWLD